MIFIELIDQERKKSVLVNTVLIQRIEPYGDMSCKLYFSGCTSIVGETYDDLHKKLEHAGVILDGE